MITVVLAAHNEEGFLAATVGQLLEGLRARGADFEIVVGSKRQEGSVDNRSWPRKLVTLGFTTILHVGFGLSVSDTHGMKAMRKEAVRSLAEGCRFRTDLFDTELVIRAERVGLGVVDLPVEVTETRPSRTPIVKRAARSLVGLARMRWVLWREPRPR